MLDLVHPSLYPVIYGRTVSKASGTPLQPRPSDVNDMFISRRFQWLPSDFDVAEDGTVTLVSPYINNIHPEEHQKLMDIIPQVLEKAVPMFEWVLSDLAREQQLPTRLDYRGENTVPCVWHDEVSSMFHSTPGRASHIFPSCDAVSTGTEPWFFHAGSVFTKPASNIPIHPRLLYAALCAIALWNPRRDF